MVVYLMRLRQLNVTIGLADVNFQIKYISPHALYKVLSQEPLKMLH